MKVLLPKAAAASAAHAHAPAPSLCCAAWLLRAHICVWVAVFVATYVLHAVSRTQCTDEVVSALRLWWHCCMPMSARLS